MKILFDHQIFSIQKYGGISRYFTQIISHLPEDYTTEIAIKYSDNEYLKKAKIITGLEDKYEPVEKFMSGIRFKGKRFLFRHVSKFYPKRYPGIYQFNENLSVELLKQGEYDVFHPTYYDDYFLPFLGGKPFVLTVHDLTYELYPEIINNPLTIQRKATLINKADHIIAVSDNTRKDLLEYYKIPKSKISVIYHANSLKDTDISKLNLPKKFFLYVGARDGYKNFKFMILSLADILSKNKNLFIVCTGNPFNQEETIFLNSLKLIDQVIAVRTDDEDLSGLYKKAIALIFPSYYEGFGIPILEAFTLGCPVILSNTSCFPEIVNDAALFFNPKSASDIRFCVERIMMDSSLRHSLINKGKERSEKFSWISSALDTSIVYKDCVLAITEGLITS